MKKLLKYLLIFLIGYLLMSFSYADINFANWSSASRSIFSILYLMVTVFCIVHDFFNED